MSTIKTKHIESSTSAQAGNKLYRTSLPLVVTIFLGVTVLLVRLFYGGLYFVHSEAMGVCLGLLATLLLLRRADTISNCIVSHSIPALIVLYVGICMPQFKMEGAFLTPVVLHAIRKVPVVKDFYIITVINIAVMSVVFVMDHIHYGLGGNSVLFVTISGVLTVTALAFGFFELRFLILEGSLIKWHKGNDQALHLLPGIEDPNMASLTIQTLFQGLFLSSADAVEIVHITSDDDDIDGYIVAKNKVMDQFTGHIPHIIGVDYYLCLLGLDPAAVTDKSQYHAEYMQMWDELRDTHRLSHKMLLKTPNGEKHIESINRLEIVDGEYYMIRVYSDITTETTQQQQLERKNQELEKYIESNMSLANFAAIASHDLKAPLRTVTSFAQLLDQRYGGEMPEKAKEYLGIIKDSTQSMDSLITDLHEYSKIDSKKFNFSDIYPQALLDEVTRDIQAEIYQSKAKVKMDVPDTAVRGDFIKLSQLLSNLIRNAIKFQKEDSKPKIKISMKDADTHWQFAVKDNGIGIEEKNQEKIFEIFSRLHSQSQYEGSGLGLATSAKIVDGHKGKIWVDSSLGEGSTFYFTIRKVLP